MEKACEASSIAAAAAVAVANPTRVPLFHRTRTPHNPLALTHSLARPPVRPPGRHAGGQAVSPEQVDVQSPSKESEYLICFNNNRSDAWGASERASGREEGNGRE